MLKRDLKPVIPEGYKAFGKLDLVGKNMLKVANETGYTIEVYVEEVGWHRVFYPTFHPNWAYRVKTPNEPVIYDEFLSEIIPPNKGN